MHGNSLSLVGLTTVLKSSCGLGWLEGEAMLLLVHLAELGLLLLMVHLAVALQGFPLRA